MKNQALYFSHENGRYDMKFKNLEHIYNAESAPIAKAELEKLLVVGAKIKLGPFFCKDFEQHTGKIITLERCFFDYENGLYTSVQVSPGTFLFDDDEPDSIYHLFDNDLSGFHDCQILENEND